jgi:undecaprenyl-diphosphatase
MNLKIFYFLYDMTGNSSVLDALGIFCAKYLPYLIILAAAAYILFKEDHWQTKVFSGIFILLSSLLARGIFASIFKKFLESPRPFKELNLEPLITPINGASFPSGHASLLFGLAFAIFIFNKSWGSWLIGLSFINGIARIFTGIHWPIDILGGIVVGFISFLLVYLFLKKPFKKLYKYEKT